MRSRRGTGWVMAFALAAAGCGGAAVRGGAPTMPAGRNGPAVEPMAEPTPVAAEPMAQPTPVTADTASTAGPAGIPGTTIRFAGGDGSTPENAIVIEGARGETDGVDAEYWYVEQVLGPRGQAWTLESQALLERDGHQFDQLRILKAGGVPIDFHFDITQYFGRF